MLAPCGNVWHLVAVETLHRYLLIHFFLSKKWQIQGRSKIEVIQRLNREKHNKGLIEKHLTQCRFLTWVRLNPQRRTEPFLGFDEGHLKHD